MTRLRAQGTAERPVCVRWPRHERLFLAVCVVGLVAFWGSGLDSHFAYDMGSTSSLTLRGGHTLGAHLGEHHRHGNLANWRRRGIDDDGDDGDESATPPPLSPQLVASSSSSSSSSSSEASSVSSAGTEESSGDVSSSAAGTAESASTAAAASSAPAAAASAGERGGLGGVVFAAVEDPIVDDDDDDVEHGTSPTYFNWEQVAPFLYRPLNSTMKYESPERVKQMMGGLTASFGGAPARRAKRAPRRDSAYPGRIWTRDLGAHRMSREVGLFRPPRLNLTVVDALREMSVEQARLERAAFAAWLDEVSNPSLSRRLGLKGNRFIRGNSDRAGMAHQYQRIVSAFALSRALNLTSIYVNFLGSRTYGSRLNEEYGLMYYEVTQAQHDAWVRGKNETVVRVFKGVQAACGKMHIVAPDRRVNGYYDSRGRFVPATLLAVPCGVLHLLRNLTTPDEQMRLFGDVAPPNSLGVPGAATGNVIWDMATSGQGPGNLMAGQLGPILREKFWRARVDWPAQHKLLWRPETHAEDGRPIFTIAVHVRRGDYVTSKRWRGVYGPVLQQTWQASRQLRQWVIVMTQNATRPCHIHIVLLTNGKDITSLEWLPFRPVNASVVPELQRRVEAERRHSMGDVGGEKTGMGVRFFEYSGPPVYDGTFDPAPGLGLVVPDERFNDATRFTFTFDRASGAVSAAETFTHFVSADVLIACYSGFSAIAGVELSEGIRMLTSFMRDNHRSRPFDPSLLLYDASTGEGDITLMNQAWLSYDRFRRNNTAARRWMQGRWEPHPRLAHCRADAERKKNPSCLYTA